MEADGKPNDWEEYTDKKRGARTTTARRGSGRHLSKRIRGVEVEKLSSATVQLLPMDTMRHPVFAVLSWALGRIIVK